MVYSGEPAGLLECEDSLTGAYLKGTQKIEVPANGVVHIRPSRLK